jgi:AMP-binding enzyme C-terminal domain
LDLGLTMGQRRALTSTTAAKVPLGLESGQGRDLERAVRADMGWHRVHAHKALRESLGPCRAPYTSLERRVRPGREGGGQGSGGDGQPSAKGMAPFLAEIVAVLRALGGWISTTRLRRGWVCDIGATIEPRLAGERSAMESQGSLRHHRFAAQVPDPDPALGRLEREGDPGNLDDPCRFYLVDRLKDMVVTGGENVYKVEVQNVLYSHPNVTEAAVFEGPDDHWGESIYAVAVPRRR